MSPKHALDGFFFFLVKSDVFSFVVLEIISGKRNIGFYQLEHALSLLGYVSLLNFFHTHHPFAHPLYFITLSLLN